jgi:hypothetical protein
MSKVAIQGNASGTGTFTIAAPNSNTDRTLTLPDEAGTVLTSASDITPNAGVAFSVKKTASQSISTATETKVTFDAANFNIDSCFDLTNNRFVPPVAGYYQFNFAVQMDFIGANRGLAYLFIGGTKQAVVEQANNSAASTYPSFVINQLLYLSGTSDYVEVYVEQQSGSTKSLYGDTIRDYGSSFEGILLRTA